MTFSIKTLVAITTISLSCVVTSSMAAQPLVSSQWLKSHLNDDNILILDIRSRLGGGSQKVFEHAHIPGAIYSNYLTAGWRVRNAQGTPNMLPDVARLEALLSGVGIEEEDHVIIIPAGKKAVDMGSATRVYWTLKVSGHANVSILNGGFENWLADKNNPIETGKTEADPSIYTVNLRPEILATKNDVRTAINDNITLIDNRPHDQFMGVNRHPASKRNGTIPGSKNIPESWLTQNGGGVFRTKESLVGIYATKGLTTQDSEISFCNTGHWASLGWFVSHEILGNKNSKLYDGSMVEWTADAEIPTKQHLLIN
ncbi:MAG: sulfurtransferase [Rhizobiaceae bacterium]